MKTKKIRRHVGGLAPDKYLTDEQVQRLIAYMATATHTNRDGVTLFVVVLLLYSGLRAAELLSLRLRDTSYVHGKNSILVRAGKGSVSRTVLMPDWFCSVLDRFVRRYRKGAKPGSYLLVAEGTSAPMTYSGLYRRLVGMGRRSGIGMLRPHVLRHVYAIVLYGICQDILFVQRQLGHSDITTTSIYARTRPESGIRQVNAMPFFGTESTKIQENAGKLVLPDDVNP